MLHENENFDGYYEHAREKMKTFLLTPPSHFYDEYGNLCVHIWELNKLFNCNLISNMGNKGLVKEINITRSYWSDRTLVVHIKIEWENGKISDIIDDDFIDTIRCGKIKIV